MLPNRNKCGKNAATRSERKGRDITINCRTGAKVGGREAWVYFNHDGFGIRQNQINTDKAAKSWKRPTSAQCGVNRALDTRMIKRSRSAVIAERS